jgi:predicted P-loop ATPase
VLDYLDSLEWDGRVRLDAWVTKFLGAIDTPYNAEIGRRALIAAVARVRSPGCKVDTVPIIEGGQGVGKSSAARVMFDPWFSDDLADLGSKDAAMQTQGAWLIEISELDAMSRAEVSRTKAFITRTTDRFRPPYGSRIIESPRSCVFWGTTNSDRYLKDETGGRRFWPIAAGKIDLTGLRQERDLLWAEANQLFERGVGWWIVNPEVQSAAIGEQTARYVGDPWDDIISQHLATTYDTTIAEILRDVLRLEAGRWSQADSNRVARCLVAHGFLRVQTRTGDKRSWRYKRSVTSVSPV